MNFTPHPDTEFFPIACAVITVSDTRTLKSDRSGKIIQELILQAGHICQFYQIIADEPKEIRVLLEELGNRDDLDVIIFSGGTGIASRDNTYDTLASLLDKTIPGFGELFRFLSYQEIGSRAMSSRAIGGIYRQKLIFSLPGSSNAVKLALSQLILPEIIHLVKQLNVPNISN